MNQSDGGHREYGTTDRSCNANESIGGHWQHRTRLVVVMLISLLACTYRAAQLTIVVIDKNRPQWTVNGSIHSSYVRYAMQPTCNTSITVTNVTTLLAPTFGLMRKYGSVCQDSPLIWHCYIVRRNKGAFFSLILIIVLDQSGIYCIHLVKYIPLQGFSTLWD